MHLPTLRGATLVAVSAAAFATLTIAAPAKATPVFTDADTVLDTFGHALSTGAPCTVTGVNDTHPDVPVVENGPAASASASASATFGNTGAPADTAQVTAQASATGKVTSLAGRLNTLDFTAQGTYALTDDLGTSATCDRGETTGVQLKFTFAVSQAGFLHLDLKSSGLNSFSEVYVTQDLPGNVDQPYVDHYGFSEKFNSHFSVLLTPGTYKGFFLGESSVESLSSVAGAFTTTVHGQFQPAGAQTVPVSGKGKKYVTLPAARACTTHTVDASITGKKKRAHQVKQVTFFVNDQLVKKVKTPGKGAVFALPVADDATADVRAEVTLFPRAKGRPGKVQETSAAYEACS
jgi:hypothetical protein